MVVINERRNTKIGIYIENVYTKHDDYISMHISSQAHGEFDCPIDLDDYEKVKKHHWGIFISKYGAFYIYSYDRSGEKVRTILLHRYIMDEPEGLIVDHIDGNPLNNRKSNLRICNCEENSQNRAKNKNNTSGHKGITWSKKDNKWMAYIYYKNRFKNLGLYSNFDDAVATREKAEEQYFGEFNRKDA